MSQNHTSINHFKVVFDKIPDVEFFTKSITLPTISVDQNNVNSPTFEVPLPGTKIIYDPITLIYNLDENWDNWKELYTWITGFARDTGFVPENESQGVANASVMGLDNHNKEGCVMELQGIFPINVESPAFDYSVSTYTDVELSATFVIQGLEIL